jgi:hypothetical protein
LAFAVTIGWGQRSRSLQPKLRSRAAGDSFLLLSPGIGPVRLGWLNPLDIAAWDNATVTPIPTSRSGNDLIVSTQLSPPSIPDPDNPGSFLNSFYLRLDFSLSATAAGTSAVVLAFRQLFMVDTTGGLLPVQCALDDVALKATPSGPVPATSGALQRVRYTGLHPLVTVAPGKVDVNAEFVDITALWWAIRHDKIGWYLSPELKGRQTNLRVLGWTGGGNPMIWFAVLPDAAKSSIASQDSSSAAADVLFFRPQAGINSFPYTPDERGLANADHDDQTMYMLARYLLSPVSPTDFATLNSGGRFSATNASAVINRVHQTSLAVPDVELLADQLQPTAGTIPSAPTPSDPMDLAQGLPWCFHLVGLEDAFNSAGGNRVLFLPLASGDTAAPYEGAALADQRTTIRGALSALWNIRAIDRTNTNLPNLGGRELWLAGHSGANLTMWACAQNNATDVGRIITFDATPWNSNLAGGINVIRTVAQARKKINKGLDVFAIVSPNLGANKKLAPGQAAGPPFRGLDDETDLMLRQTGASITVLPDFARRESYWNPLPPATSKTFVQYVLSNWSDALIAKSAANPSRWRFLFFHELAVYGGDLVPAPSGAPGGTPPTLKTFFELALGPANPRPAP